MNISQTDVGANTDYTQYVEIMLVEFRKHSASARRQTLFEECLQSSQAKRDFHAFLSFNFPFLPLFPPNFNVSRLFSLQLSVLPLSFLLTLHLRRSSS